MSAKRRDRGVRIETRAKRCAAAAAAGLAAFAAAAPAQQRPPAPVVTGSLERATATITAVDAETRLVTLRTENGREFSVEASEEVRNFDQLDVGDRVSATFYEALAAEVTEAPPGAEPVVLETERSAAGERPAGAAGLVYTAVVTIDSVDSETDTVHFTGPRGPREVTVVRPELKEFVDGLESGDRVEITYSEALAVELLPAAGG